MWGYVRAIWLEDLILFSYISSVRRFQSWESGKCQITGEVCGEGAYLLIAVCLLFIFASHARLHLSFITNRLSCCQGERRCRLWLDKLSFNTKCLFCGGMRCRKWLDELSSITNIPRVYARVLCAERIVERDWRSCLGLS